MPFASRSSITRCCSAAVPSDGIRNSTSILGMSFAAFSVPLRAIVQKSEALFVTKASRCFVPAPAEFVPEDRGWQLVKRNVSKSVQTKAEIGRMGFIGRIGSSAVSLGCTQKMFTTKKPREKADNFDSYRQNGVRL